MNRLIITLFLFMIMTSLSHGQTEERRVAERLKTFESELVIASLNNDAKWLEKFFSQKLSIIPSNVGPARERVSKTLGLIDPTLRPDEYKVRISGTISFLTSNSTKNRSFAFLDTFNKHDGKWQAIASNFSENKSGESDIQNSEQIQSELIDLENQWAQVDVTQDKSIFDRIIAPDFVSTSVSGKVRNRQEWLAAWEYDGLKRAANSEMQVHVYTDNLAVITGIDTTRGTVRRDRFTDTWMKRNSQWQCIATHVSRLQ